MSDDDKTADELIDEVVDEMENEIEVNGMKQKSWELPANSSPAEIGQKIQTLTMVNPYQILRVFRTDEVIFIVAIEGEEWSRV